MKTVIKTCSLSNESGLSLNPPTHIAFSRPWDCALCTNTGIVVMQSCNLSHGSGLWLDQLPPTSQVWYTLKPPRDMAEVWTANDYPKTGCWGQSQTLTRLHTSNPLRLEVNMRGDERRLLRDRHGVCTQWGENKGNEDPRSGGQEKRVRDCKMSQREWMRALGHISYCSTAPRGGVNWKKGIGGGRWEGELMS